ncbi:hypothetical protein KP509_14G022900 [Ceratopteris richardii]|uniref:Uncharacterized protein n=1 Tax=Ceratopteris richardii TaxID=49495 RepID=A0A8T2TBA1_CERRI|nr:hypothetical protein KP509_14G022900 [Ceratopteris richardii]KAH7415002.1 hypothetical protein KP509_14G022900 [Ceratopteris richardii]KAH7415003.1 hypothetical protein KP509_14G022900 [Ceratopteris richardii]
MDDEGRREAGDDGTGGAARGNTRPVARIRRRSRGWRSRSGEQRQEVVAQVEGGGGGWPLGLHMMERLAAARRPDHFLVNLFQARAIRNQGADNPQPPLSGLAAGDGSPFFLSTPSISSFSSSDLDTESTGSFFPERSTTLGTLIGIHHRRAVCLRDRGGIDPPPLDAVATQLLRSSRQSFTSTQRLHACCSAAFTLLMRCASAHADSHATDRCLSVSLAHLLEMERKATRPDDQEPAISESEIHQEDSSPQDGRCSQRSTLNTLFDDNGILPPHPSGAPLKVALDQLTASPTATAYVSADWSGSLPIVRKSKHCHPQDRSNASLCLRFWKIG